MGKLWFHLRVVLLALALGGVGFSLSGCQEKHASRQTQAVPVRIMLVEPKDVPVTFEFVGTTASSQQVEVRARVDGYLRDRLYIEGAMVLEGSPMFQLDDKPLQAKLQEAEAELARQKSELTTAQAHLDRIAPLAEKGVASKQELDNASGRVNSLKGTVDAATATAENARLSLGYTRIMAPVTGAASFARVQNGAYVNAQNDLLTYVAQLDPIWVDFSVSEDDMLRVRAQKKKGVLNLPGKDEFELELRLADGSLYSETGKIFFSDANYSTKTGTYLIRGSFANPDRLLRPGQFVRVSLKGAVRTKAIVVPQKAVMQGAQGFFLWVLDETGKAQIRHVEAGGWQADDWFIESGLAAGDRVVIDGIARLSVDAQVKILTDEADVSSLSAGTR